MTQSETQTLDQKTASRRIRLLQELLIVGLGYLVYSQVRGLAADRVVDAFSNGYRIVEIEQELGIFKELALQTLILPHDMLKHFFNFIYVYGLFPLLLPTAGWLFVKRPRVYTIARNAFLTSGFIAVIFFLVLPTAPPRLLGMGFIDTLGTGLAPSYNSIPGVNPFAALPSMHVGWNFLTAVAIYMALSGYWWRPAVLVLPVMMLASTVVTGNHYFLDGALGLVVAGAGLILAVRLDHLLEARRAALPAPLVAAALSEPIVSPESLRHPEPVSTQAPSSS